MKCSVACLIEGTQRYTEIYRYFVRIRNIAVVMTPKPRSYPQNDVQNNKNFTNTFLYEVLSSLLDRGYLSYTVRYRYWVRIQNTAEVLTPKPRCSYPQNDVQNNKNFTNTCSYEVQSSLFDREYLALHGEIQMFCMDSKYSGSYDPKTTFVPSKRCPKLQELH